MLLFAGLIYFLVTPRTSDPVPDESSGTEPVYQIVAADTYDLRFQYRSSPNGYQLSEVAPEEDTDTLFRYRYELTSKAEVEAAADSEEPSEGPPTISVSIYANPEAVDPVEWGPEMTQYADEDIRLSEPEPITVADTAGVEYRADGLYASDVVWVSAGEFMYRFQGEFIDATGDLQDDFRSLLDSVAFTGD